MTNSLTQLSSYQSIIASVMAIEDITHGDENDTYIVRYRGQLLSSPEHTTKALTPLLKEHQVSFILRQDEKRYAILLISDPITTIISQVFDIKELKWIEVGDQRIARYQGVLLEDSVKAHDFLLTELKSHKLTPLFREHNGAQEIILEPELPTPKESNPWINLILFILTIFTVMIGGVLNSEIMTTFEGNPESIGELVGFVLKHLSAGIPFAASLLSILLAHEFGHYLVGRYHKTKVTLPYFIPLPLSALGTLGAFILAKERIKNRRVLLDMAIAGPLAGLVVAIPILIYGLTLSEVHPLPEVLSAETALSLEGNSIMYLLAKFAVFGEWLPAPASYEGVAPIIYWIKYFFLGLPAPLGGLDVLIHPVAFAGWVGLLVTAFNLIPAGQLDGGHLLYGLIGDKAAKVQPYIILALIALGLLWQTWWLWAFLIFFSGRVTVDPLDQITTVDPPRRWLAIFGLIIFLLVFSPIPMIILTGT